MKQGVRNLIEDIRVRGEMATSVELPMEQMNALCDALTHAEEVMSFYAEWENVTGDGIPRDVVVSVKYNGVPQAKTWLDRHWEEGK